MRTRSRLLVAAVVAALAGLGAACSEEKDPHRFDGSAGQAVAQYWLQEAAGGRLPEGTSVQDLGTQSIVTLEVGDEQKDQGMKARVCVEFKYGTLVPPFEGRIRVYVATLTDRDEWVVEVVNPDGTCEGVA